jgi:hypothetical protein
MGDSLGDTGHPSGSSERRLPLWLKIAYTAFVIVLVPVYWVEYGPVNFLWFSNIALLATLHAVWRESALVASMMALAVTVFEAFWNLGYFTRLFTGVELFGLSAYMFDASIPLFVRGLSLYHVILPILLLWLLHRLGYDRRALSRQTLLAWVILPLSYLVSDPEGNENWVYGPGEDGEQDIMPGPLWVGMLMAGFPLLVYTPCHLLFRRVFAAPRGRQRVPGG